MLATETVACPWCKRRPGEWCRGPDGRSTPGKVHRSRVRKHFEFLKQQRASQCLATMLNKIDHFNKE